MSLGHGANIVRDGLVLHLDAANPKSYPGTGTTWNDLSSSKLVASKFGSQSPTYPLYNPLGYFTFSGGINGDNYSRFEVTTPTLSAISVIVFHYSTQAAGHVLRHSTDSFQIGVDGYAAGTAYNNINIPGDRTSTLNTWVCDALTFTGSNLIGYRNGIQVGTASRATTTIAGGTLRIGARSDAFASHYVGNISSIFIYDRSLLASEVLQNFNALRGRYGI